MSSLCAFCVYAQKHEMLSANPQSGSVLASYPDILINVQVYRPFVKRKVLGAFLYIIFVPQMIRYSAGVLLLLLLGDYGLWTLMA